jgi:hypothetical protein
VVISQIIAENPTAAIVVASLWRINVSIAPCFIEVEQVTDVLVEPMPILKPAFDLRRIYS